MSSVSHQLVVPDGRVDDEKLAELIGIQTEHPQLDFKRQIDLPGAPALVELAKDVGAFQVRGGYIIGGVNGHGAPDGSMDGCDARRFDEANLTQSLLRYLPEPLTMRSRVTTWQGHTVVVVFVGPHPDGYAVFRADGQYQRPDTGELKVVFRAGDIFWRNGTRSERISQRGLQEIIERQIESRRTDWIAEQQELRRRDREEVEAGYQARELVRAPVGTMNFGLSTDELRLGVLELARDNNTIGLIWLLNDARPRAQATMERDEIDSELGDLLDKLAVIGATFIEFEQDAPLERVIRVFAQIYALPLSAETGMRFDYSTSINPAEIGPRVFMAVLLRVYTLGALAVRLGRWKVVRQLALQRPEGMSDHWTNWLRHGLTMASRARQLTERRDDGSEENLSLLTLSAQVVKQQSAFHPDTENDDEILSSLARFDFLGNLAAIDDAGSPDDASFYTNWARFRQARIQPIADRLLTDRDLREAIFPGDDRALAQALLAIGQMARREGFRYDGFWGWDRYSVGDFIAANSQPSA